MEVGNSWVFQEEGMEDEEEVEAIWFLVYKDQQEQFFFNDTATTEIYTE